MVCSPKILSNKTLSFVQKGDRFPYINTEIAIFRVQVTGGNAVLILPVFQWTILRETGVIDPYVH